MVGGRTPTSGGGLGNSWGWGSGSGRGGLRRHIYVTTGGQRRRMGIQSALGLCGAKGPLQRKGGPFHPELPGTRKSHSPPTSQLRTQPLPRLPPNLTRRSRVCIPVQQSASSVHTTMQHSPLAHRRRQCPDRPVRRRAELVSLLPPPPLLICPSSRFGDPHMLSSIMPNSHICLVGICMITPASMQMFISMTIFIKLSR